MEAIAKVEPFQPDYGLRVVVAQRSGRLRTDLVLHLERLGCSVIAVDTAENALNVVEHRAYDIAFVDPCLGPVSDLAIAPRLLAESPGLTVIVLAACSPLQTVPSVVSQGTCGHLSSSFTSGQVKQIVDRVAEERRLRQRLRERENGLWDVPHELSTVAKSPAMRAAMEQLFAAARADTAVLLRGEAGVGKGVHARFLHDHSGRAKGPFVVARCLGASMEGTETELFGVGYGQFVGAVGAQAGQVELAEGGTLFVEEIGDLSAAVQTRLLRLLQERTFQRVGETRTRHVDVRLVAATTRDLEEAVREGTFREDLFYCLATGEIEVPPLRKRGEDILPLAHGFLTTFARKLRKKVPKLAEPSQRALKNYSWPGNVRELRNLLERGVMLSVTGRIDVPDLPACVAENCVSVPRLGDNITIMQVEREHILRVMQRTPGPAEAARILGISAPTLWRRLKAMNG
jgi:NtrC-family two-component system response regulator AlgB